MHIFLKLVWILTTICLILVAGLSPLIGYTTIKVFSNETLDNDNDIVQGFNIKSNDNISPDNSLRSGLENGTARLKKYATCYSSAVNNATNQAFIAQHFDMIGMSIGYYNSAQSIKNQNPNIKILTYYSAYIQSKSYQDWNVVNQTKYESWFVHDKYGSNYYHRVIGVDGYLMKPNLNLTPSEQYHSWSDYYAERAQTFIQTYPQYDGVFADNVIWNLSDLGLVFNVPYSDFESGILPFETYWGPHFLQHMQNAQAVLEGKPILCNAWKWTTFCENATHMAMWEGFIHRRSQEPTNPGYSPYTALSAINTLRTQSQKGNTIVVLSGTMHANQYPLLTHKLMNYTLACFLLAVENMQKSYYSWNFFSDANDSSKGYFSEMDIEFGNPIGEYYLIKNDTYARNFENRTVVVNLNNAKTEIITVEGQQYQIGPNTGLFINKNTNTYILTVSSVGSGSVIKNPNQPSYVYGSVVTLTAVTTTGWTFDHWSGNLGGDENPTSIIMNVNKTITAHFIQNTSSFWWNPDWSYRKEITIDHTKVGADLVNFTILISLTSDVDLVTHAQPNGNDIVFTDRNGNKLNHEIELYVNTTGHLIAWVKVANLSSTVKTRLYLYYGNALCSNQQNIQGTWNSDYLMVHHMEETGNIIDSTSHALNAVNYGTTTEPNGKIDGCRYFDSTTDRYDFGSPAALNPGVNSWTISLWTKITYVNSYQILYKLGSNAGFTLYLFNGWGGHNYFKVSDGTKSVYRYWDTSWSDGNWHYITIVINRNTKNIDLYLDGNLHNGAASGDLVGMGSITNSANFLLYGGTNGRHDEFSISTAVRNAGWIKTSYNNQNTPASFYSLGNQEGNNQPPVFGTPTPSDGSINNPLSLTWSIPINDPEGDQFSWTIQCSNGQTNSGTGATNGTKSLIVSGLAYSTLYKVWVNATDPTGSGLYTRSWYTFTTKVNNPPVFGTPSPANGSTGNLLSLTWGIPINDPEGNVFSWTIQCSNGQVSSGTGASNGTKSLVLSGLAYSTSYKVWVNATDPTGSGLYTRKWHTFTTQNGPPNSWWNTEWMYRKEITIDHTKVNANLMNFPVLINLPLDTDLAAKVQPDGDDIVFTDVQGNKLNHEIELYTSATGHLIAWVNVTSLSSTTDTKLYLYYGNSACGSQQNQYGTWSSDYLFVHHMNETGTIYDSTSHGYSATNTGTTLEPNGKIGACRYFDATTDRYDFGTATGLNPGMNSWTISLWTKIVHVNPYFQMLYKWSSNAGFTLYLFNGGNTTKYNYIKVGDNVNTKKPYRYWDTSWSDGNWHYINAVINRNTNKIDVYLDGNLHNGYANTDLTGLGSITSPANFLLYGGTNGRHDEFTISTTVRNSSWIKTCYNNQNDPSSFMSIGLEELHT